MKLKAWLKKNKMTQAQFAKLVGCDQPHVSDLVNGKVTPMLQLVAYIHRETKGAVQYEDWIKPKTKERR